MTPQPLFRAAALAALALFATTAPGHAQGLGGMLNKAKAKVNQATQTQTPRTPAAAATQATEYQVPRNLPQDPSIEEMEEYARAMMADPRPAGRDCRDENCTYRRLTIDRGYPIKFTWDQAAMAKFKKSYSGLFPFIIDISGNLLGTINNDGSNFHLPVSKALHKVKEIHLTSKPNLIDKDEPGQAEGWWFSFNPATGVLTAAMSANGIPPNSLNMGGEPAP